MSNLYKRTELLANVSIIVVALLLGGVVVKRYLLPGAPPPADGGAANESRVKPGMDVPLEGFDWSGSERTLVLVLSNDCRYCTESAPFYRRLAQQRAEGGKARLVAVLPQPVGEARQYLGGLEVKVDEVKQLRPNQLGVNGTPTLILADNSGKVIDVWVGKLPAERETDVIARL